MLIIYVAKSASLNTFVTSDILSTYETYILDLSNFDLIRNVRLIPNALFHLQFIAVIQAIKCVL